ncbi:MAG: hypothetical protein H0T79_23100 [Deltaproteobacteria bacterium]|nr:hypothetical protein [Deltaproteobacteria bacterium]
MTKLTPATPGTFARGITVSSASTVLAWLESQTRGGEPRLVRIPVLLGTGMSGFSNTNCKLGTAPDALTIVLDDAALGVGIADKARSCKGQPQCAMWLEGYWQGKDELGDYAFRVMKIHSIIDAKDLPAANYVEVEAPGPSSN